MSDIELVDVATDGFIDQDTVNADSGTSGSFCGTGYKQARFPGDPLDLNNASLSAEPYLNGILISWTMPGEAGFAVSKTKVWRSLTDSFLSAAQIAIVGGNEYFDLLTPEDNQRYYYWIEFVTINGTVGDSIGPVSATMLPTIDQLVNYLQAKIGSSQLAIDLKQEIDRIGDVSTALDQEIVDRANANDLITGVYETIRAEVAAVDALSRTETIARVAEDNALLAKINFDIATVNDSVAASAEELLLYSDATYASATRVNTLEATVGEDTALVQELQQVVVGDAQNPGISAQYMVKTDVNGYVSGFGLYNDGQESDFIIHADNFAVGFPGSGNQYPFIISTVNGNPTIVLDAQTFIPDASIGVAKIETKIGSANYTNGSTGWQINSENGVAKFYNVIARGDIEASSIKAGSANIIDTLMLQGNAVTIPEGNSGDVFSSRINIDDINWKNVGTVSMSFPGSGKNPSGLIVTGMSDLLGANINGVYANEGVAYIRALVRYPNGATSTGQYFANYAGQNNSVMLSGTWYFPVGYTGSGTVSVRLQCKMQNGYQHRQARGFGMSVLGAKR